MKIFFGGIVMAKEKDFLTLYSKVFALDGKISACGRNACLDLIHKCCELGDVNANYGSTSTGFIEISAVKALAITICPEIVFREQFFKVFDKSGARRNDCTEDDVKNLIALMTTLDIASVPFDGNE